ncbi:HAD family hydrolase [Kurthia sibirica]|uniref:HAD family hydrolase n=1 Tax=Kurthia sibirica TaxID=202750 RepID=A0A2U3AG96_9BACL|nr:HAD family hydrolase [Kurthia sibirica]PWI23550.1 HAD family hydrolase [Kurthia sibirica]GEK35404.1 phosphatase [Kurthia sibirica]
MFKAFIFDVDGTIIDTELAMLNSLQQTLKNEKNINVTHEDIHFILGIPGKDALRKMSWEPVDELHEVWSAAVLDFSHDVTVFDYMEVALKSLQVQDKKLGIVTSKTKASMCDEFNHFKLNDYFHHIVDADDTTEHKPQPEPIYLSLENLGVKTSEAIYIGDSFYDMQSAHRAGVKFALALWGAKSTAQFEDADYILNSPLDLLKLTQ